MHLNKYSRPDDGGLNVFNKPTTEDAFRIQQNIDLYERDQNFNQQQPYDNNFQNNEIGSNIPRDPYQDNRLGSTFGR